MRSTKKSRSFFESSNPVMSEEAFRNVAEVIDSEEEKMTVAGAVNKSFLLGAVLVAAAAFSFTYPSAILTWGGAIAGLIIVIVATRKIENSATWAPLYAVCEGFFVGGISAMYAAAFGGIIMQAVILTFGVFFAMLAIYKSGIIKVTKSFRSGIIMATFGIFGFYMVSLILSFFGVHLPFLHEASPLTLIISLGILAIASLNLLLDFDLFEKGEEHGAPSYMEWFAAMGLIITLVWIYIEILRILAIFSGRE